MCILLQMYSLLATEAMRQRGNDRHTDRHVGAKVDNLLVNRLQSSRVAANTNPFNRH